MRVVRHAGIGVALAALSLLVFGGTAAAHAELISVSPADGEVLDVAPTEVVLTFSEPVSLTGGSVRVLDDAAEDVSTGTTLADETITATLPDGLAEGTYTVVFEIISVDSHRIGGASVFHVGAATSEGLTGDALDLGGDEAGWGVRAGAVSAVGDRLRRRPRRSRDAVLRDVHGSARRVAGGHQPRCRARGRRPGRRPAVPNRPPRRWPRRLARQRRPDVGAARAGRDLHGSHRQRPAHRRRARRPTCQALDRPRLRSRRAGRILHRGAHPGDRPAAGRWSPPTSYIWPPEPCGWAASSPSSLPSARRTTPAGSPRSCAGSATPPSSPSGLWRRPG